MTLIAAQNITHAQGAAVTPALTLALHGFGVDYWPAHATARGPSATGALARHVPVAANPRAVNGQRPNSYLLDYYYRIHIRPARIALGNLVTAQTRSIEVWNAWPDTTHTLTNLLEANAGGMTLTGDPTLPLDFAPLQARSWTLSVTADGPPVIDAALQWVFASIAPVLVPVTGNRIIAWTIPPDWASPVVETLAWLTDVQESVDGSEYREPIRDCPRRQWEFDAIAEGQDRQQLEAALYDWSSRKWALPVWPDMSLLASSLSAASSSIPVATNGLDFVVGNLAMLWSDPRTYELVEVASITDSAITLANPTVNAWPAWARLYPAHIAYLTDAPKLTRRSDRLTTTTARLESVDQYDWPATAPSATYLGLPVLEMRPNEAGNLDAAYGRQTAMLDGDVGLVNVDDITGLAFPTQSHAWLLAGLQARAELRDVLSWLQGKANALWVPSWSDDLILTASIGASVTTLTVAWIGITRHLHMQPGRRHLRIELFDGTVFYRAVTATSEVDANTEQVALDSALGVAIDAGSVRQINWLMLCRLASDTVQIAHLTDNAGLATVATNFAGVPGEEP